MGFCKTRHWQTAGRIVQELNVCTVPSKNTQILVSIHVIQFQDTPDLNPYAGGG